MFLLALAVAPGFFWLWYFLKRDHLRPEPRHLIRRVFLLGAAAGVAAAALEFAVFSRPTLSMQPIGSRSVIVTAALIGIIEEGVKFAAIFFGVYRHAEFNEIIDGIIYAVAASMGFATLENIAYVTGGGVGVGILRAIISVPGHAFFGALMGYNMGMAKFAGSNGWRWLLSGLLLAALAHAAFDAVLLSQTALALAVLPIFAYVWRRAVVQARYAQMLDDQRIGRS
ncbi:MAG: PrsW family intramembrane metalloprotease [Armatimonadota bacterium]